MSKKRNKTDEIPHRPEEMLRALNAAAVAIQRAARTPEAVFEAVSRELERLGFHSLIVLLDEEKQHFVIHYTTPAPSVLAVIRELLNKKFIGYSFPVEQLDIYQQVIKTGQTVFDTEPAKSIEQVLPGPLRKLAAPIIQVARHGQSISAPLTVGGETTGILSVAATPLDQANIPAVTAFADQISAALENALLYEQVTRREQEVTAINAIVQALNASLNVKDVFGAVARELGDLVPFDRASIALISADRQSFTMYALVDRPDAPLGEGVTMPVAASAAGPDALAGRPHLTPDLSAETDFPGERLLYEAGLRSRVNVPLLIGDRHLGTLNLASTRPAAFSAHHLGLLQQVAGAIAAALQNAQLYERVQASEARYRHLVENVHDLIFAVDAEGVFTYCSPSVESLLGYATDEIIGRSFVEFMHPDDLPALLTSFERTLKKGARKPIDFRVRTKKGRAVWVRGLSRPVMRDGKAIGLTGVASDITARKQAEMALQRRNEQLDSLLASARHVTSTLDLDEVLQRVIESAIAAIGPAEKGTLHFFNEEQGELMALADVGFSPETLDAICLKPGEGCAGWVFVHRQPLIIDDVHTDPRFKLLDLPEIQEEKSALCVPLVVRDRAIGTLTLVSITRYDAFTAEHRDLLTVSASQMAVAIENARLYEESQQRLQELDSLLASAQHVTSTLDLDEVLLRVIESAIAAIGPAEKGSLHLFDEEQGELVVRAAVGFGPEYLAEIHLKPGEGYTGWVFVHRQPLVIGDVYADPRTKLIDLPEAYEKKSALCVPLIVRDRVIGTLSLDNVTQYDAFTSEHRDLLTIFASQVAGAIENARLFEETRKHMAHLERQTRDLELVHQVSQVISSSLDLTRILETTTEQMVTVFEANHSGILLFDQARTYGRVAAEYPSTGAAGERFPVQGYLAAERIIADAEPLVVEDAWNDPLMAAVRETMHKLDIRSMLIVPLILKGAVIGSIGLDAVGQQRFFTAEEVALAQTIASQVAVAIENARLYQTLRESEEQYRALFEQANDAVFLETLDGRILDANARACDLLGYSREELLALTVTDIVPPEIRGQISQIIEQKILRGGLGMEAENVRKDGTRVPVEVSTSLLDIGGQNLVLALVRDIRERKRLEEQLRQAQKMEAVGTLAGGIAHDFNNLLGGILGFASLIERDLPADSPLRTPVETIIRAARRGADLTNQLLAFARGGRYEVRPTSLNDGSREVVRLLSRTVDKAIAIEPRLAEDLAAVEGDAGQLHQMFLNLCLNACEAMPSGGLLTIATENVILSAEDAQAELELEPGPYVRLRVTDTGIGMDEETVQHIFEPFFTTKKGRPGRQHSGLGLSVVYGIVRSHGGAIRVHSELGRGSTFEVYLPAIERPAVVAVTPTVEATAGTETVLVVDDEDFIRALLRRALEGAGYTVLLAEDGPQALEVYRQHCQDIDLVVLDMGLPRLGGQETFRRLRESDPQVVVLISSGYAEDDRARAVLAAGARGFLAKPYDLQELLRKIRQVLDQPANPTNVNQ